MKAFKLAAIALAVASAGFTSVSQASVFGDTVQLGCTIPGAGNVSGIGSTIYSWDTVTAAGNIIAELSPITYGGSCSYALNLLLGNTANVGGAPTTQNGTCGPALPSGLKAGKWQQAAAYPAVAAGGATVAGVVPTLLTQGGTAYALQQFTLTCVPISTGGSSGVPTP